MRAQNDYQEIIKKLRLAESSSKDEFIQEIQDRKNDSERQVDKLIGQKGQLQGEIVRMENENYSLVSKIRNSLDKVQTSKETEKKIKVVRRYIKALEEFVKNQKEKKRQVLEKSLIGELSRLMSKKGLIDKVELTIHKNKMGLEARLFDSTGKETNPNSDLSKGEQQLYISALLKAILAESIHELPVLIDTPLGRLDQEHRDNILKHYYPHLSKQVIIFSTNTEIRISDIPKIENHLAKVYRLENENQQTVIHKGYFN